MLKASMGSSAFAKRLCWLLLAAPAVANCAETAQRHTLWSLQGKTNTVYLLGSIHFLSPNEDLPDAIDAAYEDAEALVMEIDMDDIDPASAQALTVKLGMLPPDETLAELLGAQRYAQVASTARELGLQAPVLQRMRPWLAALTLMQLHLTSMGLEASSGVEQRLVALASKDRKVITGLETLEQQLSILANLPQQQQIEFLLYSIEDAERVEEQVNSLLDAWRRGDAEALERILADEIEEHAQLYRPLTADRNHRWMPHIEALLRETDDYLVVVGALHLVGQDSVIELLEKKGYRVRQH